MAHLTPLSPTDRYYRYSCAARTQAYGSSLFPLLAHCYKPVARHCLPNHCRRAGAATDVQTKKINCEKNVRRKTTRRKNAWRKIAERKIEDEKMSDENMLDENRYRHALAVSGSVVQLFINILSGAVCWGMWLFLVYRALVVYMLFIYILVDIADSGARGCLPLVFSRWLSILLKEITHLRHFLRKHCQ